MGENQGTAVDQFVLSRCARHMAENCKESCKTRVAMNEHHKMLITELAKSTNMDIYNRRLLGIAAVNKAWSDWLDARKSEFVAAIFLEAGYRRWGKVTSNGVETINAVFGDARGLPIVYMIEHLVNYQRKKYHERYLIALQWSTEGKRLTQYAREIERRVADKASRKQVEFLETNYPFYRARVQSGIMHGQIGFVEVQINLDTRLVECPCQYFDEMGIACAHIKALLLALDKTTTWCHPRYSVECYRLSYSAIVPSMDVASLLSVDKSLAPPDFKRPAGRPAKKRTNRVYLRAIAVPWITLSTPTGTT
jgi:hypothetical protein